jgi:anti-sigma B factor antagonist
MEAILLLLVVSLPVAAAVRGVGRGGVWFSLATVAVVLAFACYMVSVWAARTTTGQLDQGDRPAPTHEQVGQGAEGVLNNPTDSLERVAANQATAASWADRYSKRAARFFASACLGLLLAGLFYRPGRVIPEQLARAATTLPPSSPIPAEKPPEQLRVTARSVQGVTILDLSGKIILGEGCNTLREQMAQLWAAKEAKVLLNLRDVTRVDSAGIGILVEAVVETVKGGGELKLVNLPKLVRGVMMVHRLLSTFAVYDDEEQAVASFNS